MQVNDIPEGCRFIVSKKLWDGGVLHKVPFHTGGSLQERFVRLKRPSHHERDEGVGIKVAVSDEDGICCGTTYVANPMMLVWRAPLSSSRGRKARWKELRLSSIRGIKEGHQTSAFWAHATKNGPKSLPHGSLCFSIVGGERSIDFCAEHAHDAALWRRSLVELLEQVEVPTFRSIQRPPYIHGTSPHENNNMRTFISQQSIAKTNVPMRHRSKQNWNDEVNLKPLFMAVRQGSVEFVGRCLHEGCPIDVLEDETGDTILIAACRMGREKIVQLALKWQARNDPHPQFGQTALQAAVSGGNINCVQLILEAAAPSGSDKIIVNHEDENKEAPIHVTARSGDFAILELIVFYGADIGLVDGQSRTCLHCAVLGGSKRCLAYLLDIGGDNLVEERDINGFTCLHLSVKLNQFDCVKLLLETAADAHDLTPKGLTSYEWAVELGRHNIARELIKFDDSARKRLHLFREIQDEEDASIEKHSLGSYLLPRPHTVHGDSSGIFDKEMVDNSYQSLKKALKDTHDFFLEGLDNLPIPPMRSTNRVVPQSGEMNSKGNLDILCNSASRGDTSSTKGVQCYEFRTPEAFENQRPVSARDAARLKMFGTKLDGISSHMKSQTSLLSKCASSFLFDGDLWYLYSCNGYPYYFRARDGRSVWDDPRILKQSSEEPPPRNVRLLIVPPGSISRQQESSRSGESVICDKGVGDIKHNVVRNTTCHGRCENIMHNNKIIDGGERKDTVKKDNALSMETTGASQSIVLPMASLKTKQSDISQHQEAFNSSVTEYTAPIKRTKNDNHKTWVNEGNSKSPSQLMGEDLAKHNKMISVGVPLASVLHKMKNDGVSPEKIRGMELSNVDNHGNLQHHAQASRVSLSKENVNSIKVDEDLQHLKYVKMASVGVPFLSIIHQMEKDGISEPEINLFRSKYCSERKINDSRYKSQLKDSPVKSSSSILRASICKPATPKDPQISKYLKMASVGVPPESVCQKMERDGISIEKVTALKVALGVVENSGGVKISEPSLMSRRTSVKMQKLHWNAIDENKLQNSVWASVEESEIDAEELGHLEDLFRALPTSVRTTKEKRKDSTENLAFVDSRRGNNIAIALAQFRDFTNFDSLCEAVITQDSRRLNAEKLQNMLLLLPSDEELVRIKSYGGSGDGLGRTEGWFWAVSKIDRFKQKLEVFVFSSNFSDTVNGLKKSLAIFDRACIGVIQNHPLASILGKILAVGNLMNEGAGKTKAGGITLESLVKAASKKGVDGKTTILDYVVGMTMKQQSVAMLDFASIIAVVRDASRINLQDIQNNYREIINDMKRVEATVQREFEESDVSLAQGGVAMQVFLRRNNRFLSDANNTIEMVADTIKEAEGTTDKLCSYFAEDSKTCQASYIFQVLLKFFSQVNSSKQALARRQKMSRKKSFAITSINNSKTTNKNDESSIRQAVIERRISISSLKSQT